MLGFICLEGCQALRYPCGRYEHLEQLNEGDGVTLAFLKANIAEKERDGVFIMTVEQQGTLSPGEQGRGQQQHMFPRSGLGARVHPQPAAGKLGHRRAAQPLGTAHLPRLGHGPTGEPSLAGTRAGLWGVGVQLCCSSAEGRGPSNAGTGASQDLRSPQGPDVFSKNRKAE